MKKYFEKVSNSNSYQYQGVVELAEVSPEDEERIWHDDIQEMTDTHIKQVDSALENKQEEIIKENDFAWTIIRPPQIIPGDKTGNYYQWSGEPDGRKIKWKITCGDAAHAMLSKVTDADTFKKSYQIAYLG